MYVFLDSYDEIYIRRWREFILKFKFNLNYNFNTYDEIYVIFFCCGGGKLILDL